MKILYINEFINKRPSKLLSDLLKKFGLKNSLIDNILLERPGFSDLIYHGFRMIPSLREPSFGRDA